MVASKKSHTTKTAKKPIRRASATGKKSTKKAVARPLTWRFYAVAIGIFVLAISATVGLGLVMSKIAENQEVAITSNRYGRITAIYRNLDLDNSYEVVRANVFGDKRLDTDDESRSHSSVIEYLHGDTVSNTATALDAKIKAAGFSFIGELHPESKDVQYNYASASGEYIHLTVSSKPRDDALRNDAAMSRESSPAVLTMDANAGPSSVLIKVNLDDNNQ